MIVWRPTEFAALLGVGRGRVRPGAGRLARPAAPSRARRARPRTHSVRRAVARDVPQLQRPVRLLRALQRRHPRRPQRARRAPGRPVRRRADPGQGGAVPAAVRGGARLPLDGRGGVAPARPCCRAWPRWPSSAASWPSAVDGALGAGDRLRRRRPVLRHRRLPVGLRAARQPSSRCSRSSSTACWRDRRGSRCSCCGSACSRSSASARWPTPSPSSLRIVLSVDATAAGRPARRQPGATARPRRHVRPSRRGPAPGPSGFEPDQWAAACQLLPVPTETSRGTVSDGG